MQRFGSDLTQLPKDITLEIASCQGGQTVFVLLWWVFWCGFFVCGGFVVVVIGFEGFVWWLLVWRFFFLPKISQDCLCQGHEGLSSALCRASGDCSDKSPSAALKMPQLASECIPLLKIPTL